MTYRQKAQAAPRIFRRNRLRLIAVSDPADLIDLVAACSENSRYLRFHTGMPDLRPAMAEQLASLTPEAGQALGLRTWRGRLVAEARYTRTGTGEAEVAILIADRYQGRGLGTALLATVLERAAQDGITTLTAEILNGNEAILHVLQSLAPVETVGFADGCRQVRIPLGTMEAAA
jgi:RimJ/RimL family protein N-acetyltransferase